MVVTRVAALLAIVLYATPAAAQPSIYTGILTGHIGAVSGGDIRDWTATPGGSMTVIAVNGLGAEVDLSHAGDFDTTQFRDSSITSFMLNFTAMYPHDRFRPYMVAGAGLLRVRVALPQTPSEISQSELAWDAGGGLLYMFNEAVGLRGDIRYFRYVNAQQAIPFGTNGILDFLRTSFGVSFSWPMD